MALVQIPGDTFSCDRHQVTKTSQIDRFSASFSRPTFAMFVIPTPLSL
jgi:hypothetical protein